MTTALRQPDWSDAMGTGLWGHGYDIRGDEALVLLSGGEIRPGEDPERLWPFFLTRERRRDRAAESSLVALKFSAPPLERQTVGKEEILCVREKYLPRLLDVLKNQRGRRQATKQVRGDLGSQEKPA
jgi:hypothetical protein